MRGTRPPFQQGREDRSWKDSDQESRQLRKGLANYATMMQEGFHCALHRAANLLKAISRLVLVEAGEVDAQNNFTAVKAAQDTPPTALAKEVTSLRMSPNCAKKSTSLRHKHLRLPPEEPWAHALD